jgi:uncharacterized membrane protein YphA (DoxX/SURF4 family)
MKKLLVIVRIIVGLLFIFSGLVKANDPLGLSYKMQEFFEVWGWHALNNYTLIFSILMIAFEIIAGVAVILGWQMKLFSWLLLLLIVFFTFLTAYALFSGKIRTCGCFGDCIPLTAQQSFTKDLILLVLILFIFLNKNHVLPFARPMTNTVLLLLTALFSFGLQWYVLNYLPIADCLAYKPGNSIAEKMKIPVGAIPDSTVITFLYNKQGKQVEFTADNFPEDFDDSLYQFVKRYDRLVRKGNAEPPIKDFSLVTESGTDTTQAILSRKGVTVLLFLKDVPEKDPSLRSDYLRLNSEISAKKNIPLFIVTSMRQKATEYFNNKEFVVSDHILACDFVAIKTASRSAHTFYILKDGIIIDKRSYKDFEKIYDTLLKIPNQAN